MNILIAGGGTSGSYVVEQLKDKNNITLIEQNTSQYQHLKESFPEITIIRGDACEPDVLEKANIVVADTVVALTGDDEDNLVISFLAKFTHKVPFTIARINNPKNEWLFTNMWGVDVALSSAVMVTNLIKEEIGLGELITVMKLQKENLVLEEIVLTDKSAVVGKRLGEIRFPEKTRVMVIISDSGLVIPDGNTIFKNGDKIILITQPDILSQVSKILE